MQSESAARTVQSKHAPQTSPAQAGPFLVRPSERGKHHSALALWHLLSLDAPTVAAVWTYFVAKCCHVTLPWTSPASMFVAVWMLYAADRLLDAHAARNTTRETRLEERHRFHADHQRWFMTGIGVCAVVLAAMLFRATGKELQLYAALGSLLFVYFFLIHLWPMGVHSLGSLPSSRLPKELAVGGFFAAAVFIPTVARASCLRLSLIPSALIFASVCTLNCLYIYAWEHPQVRSAHWTTRFALHRLPWMTFGVMASSLCVAMVLFSDKSAPVRSVALPMACCLSTACFVLLQRFRTTMQGTTLRAAVDLALLAPVLLVPFLHLL